MVSRTLPLQTQQELLREAMDTLAMTRKEFATRLSVPLRTLNKWLSPDQSPDFRPMPEMGKAYVREILQWHAGQYRGSIGKEQLRRTSNK